MLVAFEAKAQDATANNQRLLAAQRSVSAFPSAKWTVWVDRDLKDRFHAAKLAACPAGSTHSVFTEMLLSLRDESIPTALPVPAPAPAPRAKKQPFIQNIQHIAHSLFAPNSTSRSLFSSTVSSKSRLSSESSAPAPDHPTLHPPLNLPRPKFTVFAPRTPSTDSNSTANSSEAEFSLMHDDSQHHHHDSKSISKHEDSSLSSIELYSDSDTSSVSPKYAHGDDEKAETASMMMQSDRVDLISQISADDKKMDFDTTFQQTQNHVPYHCFYFPGQTLAFQQLQQQQQQQQLPPIQSTPAYFPEFSNPPGYGDSKKPSFEPLASSDTKKMDHENLFDPLDPSTGLFWDQNMNPALLVDMYTAAQAADARKKKEERDGIAFVVSSSSGGQQQQPQQPSSNEPLPPYLGIMPPLPTTLAGLSLCAAPIVPVAVQQLHQPQQQLQQLQQQQQQQTTLDLEADVLDLYLNAMADSPNFEPTVVSMEDVVMDGDAGSPVFADAVLVLPPPAYDGELKEEDGMMLELGMELENFVGLNGF
ncbi:hypothetical protein HDU98_007410 [Podochytrium sp. JEL0797]|nr:hypothetical protein HDU98_007410 [Podochytrium sp. JEL0797]